MGSSAHWTLMYMTLLALHSSALLLVTIILACWVGGWFSTIL
jgi:hypothetical protein